SNKLTMMSGSQSESLTLAMGHYDQAAYQLALKAFSSLGDEAALDKGLLLLYQGICYLEIGQELKAKAHFSQVLEIPGTRLAGPAAWYLGLTHLKLGDLSQAKQFFRQAATLDSAYKGQVEAVLQDLG
ncbi:MAG TPA: tetratricopeptide repeat protein, partial [Bacteroidetes bacterium]|nr:tetratricopeptide repeat protein [Bacteroidota bacterium]